MSHFPALRRNYASAHEMVSDAAPREPVYCFYPHVLRQKAQQFIAGFPGRVLYAVKANPHEQVLTQLYAGGVRNFDTASVPEMKLVHELCADSECYFMAPVRLRGAVSEAFSKYGVRNFVVDYTDELNNILSATKAAQTTIFVRMACHDPDATYDLSTKFGATTNETVTLLRAVADAGAKPALAFNVGSLVLNPDAYARALDTCAQVIQEADVEIHALDVGGGFPSPYPGLAAIGLNQFFIRIDQAIKTLALNKDTEYLAEPGRALVAEGMSVVCEVLLRKDQQLYLNDGIWGSFIEPMLSKGLVKYPTRVYRGNDLISSNRQPYTLYGPTCDSTDTFPKPFDLPVNIQAGDWIEFGMMGAYSLTNRTGFNGFYPEQFVVIVDPGSMPPSDG